MDQMQALWAGLPEWERVATHLFVTLLIFILGWIASNLAGRWVSGLSRYSGRIDPTVLPIVRSVAVWAIRIVVLLAVLARLGVQTASLVAMLGASALAIGLALQGTLQNFAAGIMLLVLRPVRAGEAVTVVGKGEGTVDEIGLFMTRIVQFDGVHLLLPNTLIWGNPVINYSRNETRRLDIMIGVHYGDDLDEALQALRKLISDYPQVLDEPAADVMVLEYRDSVIMVNIRLWTPSSEYWDLLFELRRRVPQALREAGLRSPIPIREVRAVKSRADAAPELLQPLDDQGPDKAQD